MKCARTFAVCFVLCISRYSLAQQAGEYRFCKELTREQAQTGEIVAFQPDSEIYAETRDGLPDLRIIDNNQVEIPYQIELDVDRRVEREQRTLQTEIQALRDTGKSIEISLRLPKNSPPAEGLRFSTPLKDFERKIKVAGSADGENWTPLVAGGLIFDYSRYMDVKNSEIALPANTFQRFKITVEDVTDESESPYKELTRTTRAGKEAERVEKTRLQTRPFRIDQIDMIYNVIREDVQRVKKAEYLTAKFQVENEADKKLSIIEVATWREPLTRFTLETPSKNFNRRASVQVQTVVAGRTRLQPDRVQWQEIGSAAISKLQLQNFQRQQLTIDFPEHRENKYRIVIENEDNPPLDVAAVKSEGNVYRILFLAEEGKSYHVLYGSENAKMPKYETAAVLGSLRKGFQPAQGRLGPQADNVKFVKQPDFTLRKLLGNWYILGLAVVLMVAVLGWGLYCAGRRLEKLPPE